MKKLWSFATLCLVLLAASVAWAGDPSGTWKWTLAAPTGDKIDVSLTLELKEGKLTGKYSNQFGDAPITDASFKDDVVAFAVEREMAGTKFTVKYDGKLAGDAITGKVHLPGFGGGEPTTMDWNATRAK
jgi:hypothetical protein